MLAGLTTAPGNSCSLSRLFSAKVWKGIFSCVYVSCEIHVYIINTLPFEIQFQKLSFIYNPNILTAVFFPAVVTPPLPTLVNDSSSMRTFTSLFIITEVRCYFTYIHTQRMK